MLVKKIFSYDVKKYTQKNKNCLMWKQNKNSSMMFDLDVVKRLATDRQSVPFPETQRNIIIALQFADSQKKKR